MTITLSSLIYYPIKACRGFEVFASELEYMGLRHDRLMMLVTPQGKFLTQREFPKLAQVTPTLADDTLTLTAAHGFESLSLPIQKTGAIRLVDIWKSKGIKSIDQGEEAADWFSEWLGSPVRLVHIAEGRQRLVSTQYAVTPNDHTGFADGYPILLISEGSLKALNSRLEKPIPMNRFRPNVVLKGCEPFAEDSWTRIKVGDIEMAVVKPCGRCVVTTIDKDTLERDKEPLKTLAAFRKQDGKVMFGQNVIPLNEGRLEAGMAVQILQ